MYSIMGRTTRHRNRKKTKTSSSHIDLDRSILALQRWMKQQGLDISHLVAAHFADTGRGVMTRRNIKQNNIIISVPEKLLLTTKSALDSYLGKLVRSWQPSLSPLLVLCIYLICERHRGEKSFWNHYIQSLPVVYSTPTYWTESELEVLPTCAKDDARKQVENVKRLYEKSVNFWKWLEWNLPEFRGILTYEKFIWAWNVVNTRSVYMLQTPNKDLSKDLDHFALVPFLDLLNHTSEAKVNAGFNSTSRCYEISTLTAYKKYEQVFINYGPHDNKKLLIEYGFVLSHNIHNIYTFDINVLKMLFKKHFKITFLDKKFDVIIGEKYHGDLTCSMDGLSWALTTSLQILGMDYHSFQKWPSCLSQTTSQLTGLSREIGQHLLISDLNLLKVQLDQQLAVANQTCHEQMTIHLIKQYIHILQTSLFLLNSRS